MKICHNWIITPVFRKLKRGLIQELAIIRWVITPFWCVIACQPCVITPISCVIVCQPCVITPISCVIACQPCVITPISCVIACQRCVIAPFWCVITCQPCVKVLTCCQHFRDQAVNIADTRIAETRQCCNVRDKGVQ